MGIGSGVREQTSAGIEDAQTSELHVPAMTDLLAGSTSGLPHTVHPTAIGL